MSDPNPYADDSYKCGPPQQPGFNLPVQHGMPPGGGMLPLKGAVFQMVMAQLDAARSMSA